MRTFVCILIVFSFFGCANPPSIAELPKLNGYWEITKVTFADGQEKDYGLNTTIDYIEITHNKGFRKKMQPKLDGTYSTSNDAEFFTVSQREASLFLEYQNGLSQWEEQLLKISEDSYTVINEEQIRYTYRRYQPINVKTP